LEAVATLSSVLFIVLAHEKSKQIIHKSKQIDF